MSRFLTFVVFPLLLCLGDAGLAQRALAQSAMTCHLKDGPAPAQTLAVSVGVKRPAEIVRTGEPISVEWTVGEDIGSDCRTPLYLVLSTTARSRFEGEKFLAFPPGAPGPYAIKHQLGRTRVFVPLHLGANQLRGTVLIKIFQDGPVALDWALVEVPRLKADPKTTKDFAFGQERVGPVTQLAEGLSVRAGNPEIVIRDRFTIEAPQTIIRSNSGEFDLQVFNKFYRVVDSKTGELLQERNGWDPNFSPSSRFLGAFADGPGFEIIDLYSGTVAVTKAEIGDNEYDVHLVAWSPGDALFALSLAGWGGIAVQQALVDGSQRSFPDTRCRACYGIETAFFVDFESALTMWGDESFGDGWESLVDSSVGEHANDVAARAQIPSKPELTYEIRQKQIALQRELSAQQLAKLGRAAFVDADALKKLRTSSNSSFAWHLGGSPTLSHDCSDKTKLCQSVPAVRALHKGRSARPKEQKLAEARLVATRGSMVKAAVRTRSGTRGAKEEQNSVWDRLLQLGLDVNSRSTLKPPVQNVDSEPDLSKIAPIIASIPSATERFPIRENVFDIDERYSGRDREATHLDPFWIQRLATFSVRERTYWLIQAQYPMMASSRHFSVLVHGTKTGPSTMVDLASRLKFRVGSDPSGLVNGQLEETDKGGLTRGFGSWPRDIDKVTIAFDRYMVASGHWLDANLRWVLLFDLQTDQILMFNRDVPAATNVDEFAVTEDGRTLVQSNIGGQLHFYDVASGKVTLRGFQIDDELIVYDARGYYTASPEGSQFIFLKFPGLSGYNSLQQFARTLKRPDLIKAVLAGRTETPDPRLTPPASLELAVEVTGQPASRFAKVRVSANSTIGLEKLRLFVDGRPAGDYPLSGLSATLDVTVPLKPESRWITVIAVDGAGYESVPRGAALLGTGKPADSRLFAISIGTDRYEDTANINQLSLAKADAANFAKAVQGLKGTIYAKVEVTPFLDAERLGTALPAKLREVADTAQATDTIMLFAAGHGFRDPDTGQFFLATRETRLANLAKTSIAWDEIAKALEGTKARVIVLLDACHSGAADGGANDDAVSSLINGATSMTVLAAAKGRQESLEDARVGGGRFTSALVRAITTNRKATDANANGVIELAELYGAVKKEVVTATHGLQTPWIARNLMVGEIPLF